jgi:AcrR family transcriptional regulator
VESRPAATRRGLDTRRRALEVALGTFGERGYAATSVRDIAERLGLTVPVLYYHFGSKDGLLAALVEPLVEDGEALLAALGRRARRAGEARWAPEFEEAALAGYFDTMAANRDVFLFVSADRTVRRHPEAGVRLASQGARFFDLLAGQGADTARRVRCAAAIGAVRRPLRLEDLSAAEVRPLAVAAALGALRSPADPPSPAAPPSPGFR